MDTVLAITPKQGTVPSTGIDTDTVTGTGTVLEGLAMISF